MMERVHKKMDMRKLLGKKMVTTEKKQDDDKYKRQPISNINAKGYVLNNKKAQNHKTSPEKNTFLDNEALKHQKSDEQFHAQLQALPDHHVNTQKLVMQSIKKGFLVDENPFKREQSVGMLKEILKKDEEVDLSKYRLCDCGYPLIKEEREIEMETDVYFITFASMNIEFISKVELNQKDISNCIRNSLFVFIVQVILILGIGWEYLSLDSYKQGSTEMLTVRFVACAMLHVMI
jgi:hypothetical protein